MTTRKPDYADIAMLTSAVEQLHEALRPPATTSRAWIAAGFDRVNGLLEALPPTTDDYCFDVNWIAGAYDCWSVGDLGAARYQLEMVRKKLTR
jgi:hypothetical protein